MEAAFFGICIKSNNEFFLTSLVPKLNLGTREEGKVEPGNERTREEGKSSLGTMKKNL